MEDDRRVRSLLCHLLSTRHLAVLLAQQAVERGDLLDILTNAVLRLLPLNLTSHGEKIGHLWLVTIILVLIQSLRCHRKFLLKIVLMTLLHLGLRFEDAG